jgi:IS5 family transposase
MVFGKLAENLAEMIGKIEKNPQLEIFNVPLKHFIKENHELVLLAHKIDWEQLQSELSVYYCEDNGRPCIPIRTIAGIVLLKRIFDESDESVLDRWAENPYWQYFCGEVYFQHEPPFDRTELIKFRKRIGEEGSEQLLKMSVQLFPQKEVQEDEVLIDTTVQEKNITYPTDVKLQKKIIEKCRKIAVKEGIELRQSYRRELKQLMIDQRFHSHPRRRKKARAAARRIKVIAGRVVRDVERKMDNNQKEKYALQLGIFNKVLTQQRNSSDKVYSLHQPHVKCIAKGKEAKKYEFGNKSSIVKTKKSGIIVGAMAFTDNVYDGDTLLPQLVQTERITGHNPKVGIADRGYKGRKSVNGVQIVIPEKLPSSATNYQKQKARKRFRARAGIEPVIGHLKQDHRMSRNYLLDEQGDLVNTLLAAAGFNLRKMLQRLKAEALDIIVNFIWRIFAGVWNPKYAF